MRYDTHMTTSVALGATLSFISGYPFSFGYVTGILLGSLLPDIDEPNSYIGRRSLGIAKVVKKKFGHRGLTHSFVAWIIVSLLYFLFSYSFLLGLSMGYLFHLIGDYFTNQGVRLFIPFDDKRYKAPITFKVGSSIENVIFWISMVSFIVLLINGLAVSFVYSTIQLLSSMILRIGAM
ncbi:metal-dependent hydrolase [Bacillus sp. FJAT-51639]|uniref:Metal-dependent hydrolase n=1 Tax=Bacillus bruguierae TaxID=3127667 RepID=A0ABU8FJS6_9BACI